MKKPLSMKNKIEYLRNFYSKDRVELLERLLKDVTYELPWIGERLWIADFRMKQYEAILKDLAMYPEEEVLKQWIFDLERFTTTVYNVRESNTGALFRETSTWKFVESMRILKELKEINN